MSSPAPDHIQLLAKKWQEGNISQQEKMTFEKWYDSIENRFEIHSDETETEMQARIYRSILERAEIPTRTVRSRRLAMTLSAAAAAAVIILGIYLFGNDHQEILQPGQTASNDIAPGTNGATLTLADGKKIAIDQASKGNIAAQYGVNISKTADGKIIYELTGEKGSEKSGYNTLSTARGQQAQLRLGDGTMVFLNAESSLEYPTTFARLAKREVYLKGEGYFEAAKDKLHPFVVKTTGQLVQVLGTHFNINSYPDEAAVKTTLVEGSVRVNGQTLKPSEQSQLKDGKLTIVEVDPDNAVAWKNGTFLFEEEPLGSIMRKIERWYDVEVVFGPNVDQHRPYGGGVSRYDKVSKVLEKLAMTGNVHFKIEGRRITVMP